MTFHVYRLYRDDEYVRTDPDHLAGRSESMQGVLWRLHNEVVTSSCPRRGRYTRIVRLKATVFNTDEPFIAWRGQFGPYVKFQDSQCTEENCTKTYQQYGFVVGCLPWQGSMGGLSYGNKTQSYSFPGACPTQAFADKDEICRKQEPGGRCDSPMRDHSETCTWNLEEAGEVRIDELEGIQDYALFCKHGGVEYDEGQDKGQGCSFWNAKMSMEANNKRLQRLKALFEAKHAERALPDPSCDSKNAQCKYHESCNLKRLSGNCCPADNGDMLACCEQASNHITNVSLI